MRIKALIFWTLSLLPMGLAEANDVNGAQEEMVFLLVDKVKLRADLLTWPEDEQVSERLLSFRIAIGKEEGDKQKRGDNRTPEGIYFAKGIIDGQGLPAKYGPYAIPIDFPNPLDRYLGKTGYGIWLHGVEQDNRIEAAKVTEGCVAFYNADIETLTQWLMPDHSVVVIARDAKEVNRPLDIAQVKKLTQGWIEAWAQRDLNRYISFYSEDFKHLNRSVKAYENYKRRVFASYREMSVQMSDIRVFSHDRYAVAIMNQDFNGDDRYRTNGRKILYWKRMSDKDEWKLFHEEFDPRPIRFTSYSREKLAQIIKTSPSTKVLQEPAVESRL
jgi:murein L,D-transpeptidase YafK